MHGSRFDLKDGKVVRWVEGSGIMSLIGKTDVYDGDGGENGKTTDCL